MVRVLILLLVITGALAAVFGLVLGVGVMRMSLQAPVAGGAPTTQPVVTSTADAPQQQSLASIGPPPIPPAELAARPAGKSEERPAVAGTIVLRPEDAVLRGDFLRLLPNGDLRFGARRGVSAAWEVRDAREGEYRVDLTYAAADEGGGQVQVQVRQDGGDSFTAQIEPTGGADRFRTVRGGTLHFTGRRKAGLLIRSRGGNGDDLMYLRKVELIPAD